MGFFSKKKNDKIVMPEGIHPSDMRSRSDKSIKPKAPKNLTNKKVFRTLFWVFMSLLLIKGAIAFAQGKRTIVQNIINGDDTANVSDTVKGFAGDFASEYFTWNINDVNDRSSRLSKFVKGVPPDMGLKGYDVKDSSIVTSVEVYSTRQIDTKHVDVTIVVWRDIQPAADQNPDAKEKAMGPSKLHKKIYMVVPVTLAAEGPVIQSYPRFVNEQKKGETVEAESSVKSVTDDALLTKGKNLADSFLKAWYEGNVNQLRYFYADSTKSPEVLEKSDFTYDKIDSVTMFENPPKVGESPSYLIKTDVLVKSSLDEPFANHWNLQVTLKDDRLYVVTNDTPVPTASTKQMTSGKLTPEASSVKEPAQVPTTAN